VSDRVPNGGGTATSDADTCGHCWITRLRVLATVRSRRHPDTDSPHHGQQAGRAPESPPVGLGRISGDSDLDAPSLEAGIMSSGEHEIIREEGECSDTTLVSKAHVDVLLRLGHAPDDERTVNAARGQDLARG